MRRRITAAIVGVTAFVLLALGIPLAVVIHRQLLDSELLALQAAAAETLTEIDVPLDPSRLAALSEEPDRPPPFDVYAIDGRHLFGSGPDDAEPTVLRATSGSPSSDSDGVLLVATPITDRNERVVGVLRLSRSVQHAERRVREAWLVMAVAELIALGVAWLLGRRLARRLGQPVAALVAEASRIGEGGVLGPHENVGIPEIDVLGQALVDSSRRVNEALGRERRFSADVSHQLRTPLAGLRLRLEAALETPGRSSEHAVAALEDLDRLDATVTHLLRHARDAAPTVAVVSLADAARGAVARSSARVHAAGRSIVAMSGPDAQGRCSQGSIDQVLDVLIGNALDHGVGEIRVSVRVIPGGAAVDVADEGVLEAPEEVLFRRGSGANHGIGLALARSLAEAEGGRVLLADRRPTTFSLVVVARPTV